MGTNHPNLYPMNHKEIGELLGVFFGTGTSITLCRVTISTASSISAGVTVIVGMLTGILTIMKIVQWVYWWRNRKNSTKPPTI